MFNDGLKHFLPFSLKWMDEEKCQDMDELIEDMSNKEGIAAAEQKLQLNNIFLRPGVKLINGLVNCV